jgi:hypothetical protein
MYIHPHIYIYICMYLYFYMYVYMYMCMYTGAAATGVVPPARGKKSAIKEIVTESSQELSPSKAESRRYASFFWIFYVLLVILF